MQQEQMRTTCIERVIEYYELFGERQIITVTPIPSERGEAERFLVAVNGYAAQVSLPFTDCEQDDIVLQACQPDPGRETVARQILHLVLVSLDRDVDSVYRAVIQEVPAPEGASCVLSFRVAIDDSGWHVVGLYEDEYGPYYEVITS